MMNVTLLNCIYYLAVKTVHRRRCLCVCVCVYMFIYINSMCICVCVCILSRREMIVMNVVTLKRNRFWSKAAESTLVLSTISTVCCPRVEIWGEMPRSVDDFTLYIRLWPSLPAFTGHLHIKPWVWWRDYANALVHTSNQWNPDGLCWAFNEVHCF